MANSTRNPILADNRAQTSIGLRPPAEHVKSNRIEAYNVRESEGADEYRWQHQVGSMR
jgi:hypothetical protein